MIGVVYPPSTMGVIWGCYLAGLEVSPKCRTYSKAVPLAEPNVKRSEVGMAFQGSKVIWILHTPAL